ncbi:MAG: hypothetical protein ABIO70_30330 [Pseudomonadota bacterium]
MSVLAEARRTERLRVLLGLEIHRVTDDLLRRRPLLVEVWGRHRARTPFLDTCSQRYQGLPMTALLELEREEIEAIEAFYVELDELRFYLAHTEDMPRALAVVLDGSLVRLTSVARAALSVLAANLEAAGAAAAPWLLLDPDLRWAAEASGAAFGEE